MTGPDALVLHAARNGKFAASIAGLPLKFRAPNPDNLRMLVNLATSGPEPGNWLISVDRESCHVEVGSVPRPDAWVFTDSEIGCDIIRGSLSIEDALEDRLLDCEGDGLQLGRLRACFDFGVRS